MQQSCPLSNGTKPLFLKLDNPPIVKTLQTAKYQSFFGEGLQSFTLLMIYKSPFFFPAVHFVTYRNFKKSITLKTVRFEKTLLETIRSYYLVTPKFILLILRFFLVPQSWLKLPRLLPAAQNICGCGRIRFWKLLTAVRQFCMILPWWYPVRWRTKNNRMLTLSRRFALYDMDVAVIYEKFGA